MREGLLLLDPVGSGVDAYNWHITLAVLREASLHLSVDKCTRNRISNQESAGGTQSSDYTVSGVAIAFALALYGNTFPRCFSVS